MSNNTNKKVLILTVGGSPNPLITSINNFEPDEIVFICSDRSVSLVEKGILDQTIKEYSVFFIERVNPDDVDQIFERSEAIIKKYQLIGANILSDFTGGTKCMNLGLGMAASILGVPLQFMGGKRQDLVKVSDGTQAPILINFKWIDYKIAEKFFNDGHYAIAEQLFNEVKNLSPAQSLRAKATRLATLSKGLDAWDNFNHQQALANIRALKHDYPVLITFLIRIVEPNGRKDVHKYELLFDLLANSERRASQARYDDACARLYRAVEFVAQKRLSVEYDIDTSDVKRRSLPKSFEPPESKSKDHIQLSRYKAYELLTCLDDPLGQIYENHKNKINDKMILRNNSILAHGLKAVTGVEYRNFNKVVVEFLSEAVKTLGIKWETIKFPVIE